MSTIATRVRSALVALAAIGMAGCGASLKPVAPPAAASALDSAARNGGAAQERTRVAKESVLYSFLGKPDGAEPQSALAADKAGALYGTTTFGGSGSCGGQPSCGAVFKLTPSGSGYSEGVIYNFDDAAFWPTVGVTLDDKTGALYGATQGGGGSGDGAVFKLTPSASGYLESLIWSFAGGSDGNDPTSKLILDSKGALYGTTLYGGAFDAGTVFKLTPSGTGYTESVLYVFDPSAGDTYEPTSLVLDASGALYGTSVGLDGAVFELTPSGSGYTESVLHFFQGSDGSQPEGKLLIDKSGALFGTTYFGGRENKGAVFELTPSGSGYTESTIYNFQGGRDGANPYAGLRNDKAGDLYGTTYLGGGAHRCGVVFELTPSHGSYLESILYAFETKRGCSSEAGLIADSAGTLYGTTQYGGSGGCLGRGGKNIVGCGTVFKLTP